MRANVTRIRLLLVAPLICILLSAAFALAEESAPTEARVSVKDLEVRLEKTRNHLAAAQEEVDALNTRFYRIQHDVVYTNFDARKIYMEIKKLESVLGARRTELNKMIMKLPEMTAAAAARKEAYDKVQKLQDTEALILKDLRAARWREGPGKREEPEDGSR